jgi:hypothetical protein
MSKADLFVYDEEGDKFIPASMSNPLPISSNVKARIVQTLNGVTVAGSREVIGPDQNRTGLTIRNDSTAKMYFRTDGEAGDGVGYPMDAGRGYSFEALGMLPSNPISVWCGTADNRWAILYSTQGD